MHTVCAKQTQRFRGIADLEGRPLLLAPDDLICQVLKLLINNFACVCKLHCCLNICAYHLMNLQASPTVARVSKVQQLRCGKMGKDFHVGRYEITYCASSTHL